MYGPLTWHLYDQLHVWLQPQSPDWLRGLATALLPVDGRLLEARSSWSRSSQCLD